MVFEAEVLANYEHILNSFGAATNSPITYSLRKVATGDFNKDGNLDLAFASTGVNRNVSIALGDGTGKFGAATNLNTSPPSDLNSWSVAVGDFNKDGNSDLVTANRPLAKKIYVIIKDFKFNPPKLTHNCKLLTTNYNADHNGDGDSDNDSTIF